MKVVIIAASHLAIQWATGVGRCPMDPQKHIPCQIPTGEARRAICAYLSTSFDRLYFLPSKLDASSDHDFPPAQNEQTRGQPINSACSPRVKQAFILIDNALSPLSTHTLACPGTAAPHPIRGTVPVQYCLLQTKPFSRRFSYFTWLEPVFSSLQL